MKALPVVSAIVLIAACFFPWVYIEAKDIAVSGVKTAGTNFGKPAYLHIIFTGLCLLLLFVSKGWSQKAAVFFAALNVAWAVRNFSIVSGCHMGDCPEKQPALYMLIPASIFLLAGALFWKKN